MKSMIEGLYMYKIYIYICVYVYAFIFYLGLIHRFLPKLTKQKITTPLRDCGDIYTQWYKLFFFPSWKKKGEDTRAPFKQQNKLVEFRYIYYLFYQYNNRLVVVIVFIQWDMEYCNILFWKRVFSSIFFYLLTRKEHSC